MLAGNGELFTALLSAFCKNLAAVLCAHTLAETMLVHSLTIVRLECSFHCSNYLIVFICDLTAGVRC